ncbi:MAG: hypothetical protein EXS25_02405 [Pedosphaera sp.]|nr:hypothetical protein [Pedosphaera sp.]
MGARREKDLSVDSEIAKSTAWELLRRSLSGDRLAHGYLFLGDDMGLLEAGATALAQTLNCTSPLERTASGRSLEPCGRCSACRRIQAANHADVTWVRPENKSRQISAAQSREVVRTMSLKPMDAAHKVAVFIGADRMNTSAANIFLKTLEEPPEGSVLILLSIEPGRLLETILSRCQRVNFGVSPFRISVPVAEWVGAFARLAAPSTAGLLSRYSLLSTLLSSLTKAREGIEERLTAASPLVHYPDATPDQRERWEDELAAAIEGEYRRLRGEYLSALQAWLRDVWLIVCGAGTGLLFLPELSTLTSSVAARINDRQALANLEAWEGTQGLLHSNVQEALALEVGLLRLSL